MSKAEVFKFLSKKKPNKFRAIEIAEHLQLSRIAVSSNCSRLVAKNEIIKEHEKNNIYYYVNR